MATSANGGGGGVAAPARHAKVVLLATTVTPRAFRSTPSRFPALLWKKANPTKTNPTSSPVRFAPIGRQAASGGPAVADVVADAAGAAGWRTVWPDRLSTNSGRHRLRKQPTRLPISTGMHPRSHLCRKSNQNPLHRCLSHNTPIVVSRTIVVSRRRLAHPPRWRLLKRPKEPRGGVQPCAKR